MGVGVLAAKKVTVVGGHHIHTLFSCQINDAFNHLFGFGKPEVLHLKEEVLRPDDVKVGSQGCSSRLDIPTGQRRGNLTFPAARQSYDSLAVLGKYFLIYSRLVVETFEICDRGELNQVLVAGVGRREQGKMVVCFARSRGFFLLGDGSGSNVGLYPYYGLYPPLLHRLVEGYCAEHVPVIGHRHRRHLEPTGLLGQFCYADGTVKKAVLGMKMQVDEVW
ncbi:hypothetical protein ES703_04577 [subsurface metagenome]